MDIRQRGCENFLTAMRDRMDAVISSCLGWHECDMREDFHERRVGRIDGLRDRQAGIGFEIGCGVLAASRSGFFPPEAVGRMLKNHDWFLKENVAWAWREFFHEIIEFYDPVGIMNSLENDHPDKAAEIREFIRKRFQFDDGRYGTCVFMGTMVPDMDRGYKAELLFTADSFERDFLVLNTKDYPAEVIDALDHDAAVPVAHGFVDESRKYAEGIDTKTLS